MTIKHVAAVAGVSVSTASRVMTGNPATSVDARACVLAAARELGYRPNAQARSLRLTRTATIGLLLSDIRNPFFAELAHAAEHAALDADHITLLGNANENIRQQDRYLETYLSQRVDGVIVAAQGEGGGSLRSLLDRGVPTVFVDRTLPHLDVPSVTADNEHGVSQAVSHLVARGHTRIGYIAGPQAVSTGRARHDAFVRAVAQTGLDTDPGLIYFGDFQAESGTRAAEALLASRRPPTAILAADSLMAIGALRTLRHQGIRIGTDLDLVAFDDIDWFAQLDPPLTVVAHDAAEMGRLAVSLLLKVIAGERPESVVLPTRLVVRESSGGPAEPDRQPDRQPDQQPDGQPDRQPGQQPDRQPDQQPGQ